MTDFAQAFLKGQRAAAKAMDARNEIVQVLQDFAEQLSHATDGKISIKVTEGTNAFFAFAGFAERLAKLQDPSPGAESKESIKWITASRPTLGQSRHLARWNRPHQGYPCTLTYNGNEVRCHDRAALERGLMEMLQNAWVGGQLRQLLELPDLPAQLPEEPAPPDEPAG